ncbi:MAG: polysaccharide biosynthesis protein [Acidobacteriota bacterium]
MTGATGSFGRRFLHTMHTRWSPRRLIVFSRDEQKQHELQLYYRGIDSIRYVIGDVRNLDRLRNAFSGVDVVVHAAAMKQIPTCETNAWEAMLTNVIGARNVILAAVDARVEWVMNLSTDKAVHPISVYGATKLLGEKLFVEAAALRDGRAPRFSTVRYGNVLGTRGSVVPMFVRQRDEGVVTVTDSRMTRFWITRDEGVEFVIRCVERMEGGEVFVPKAPSAGVMDLVATIAPDCRIDYIGIREGEKLHEVLIAEDEARRTRELDDMFVIWPSSATTGNGRAGRALPDTFQYTSDGTARRLTRQELKDRLVESGDLPRI